MDSIATTSITSADFLRNAAYAGNQFQNWIIHRPGAASSADTIRFASTLANTTGTLSHSGANYSDTTVGSETVELWKPYGIRPDTDVLNAINRALEFVTFQSWEPLSLAADAAMRINDVNSWGTPVNASANKVGTRYAGFLRSMAVTNSATNGYLPTANIHVTPRENVLVAALARTESGTGCQLTFWDVTNSATFGTAITHSNQNFMLMRENVTVPTGCYNINIRLGGQGSSDVTHWQALWVIRTQASTPFILPDSYLDERFKLDAVATSDFMQTGNSAYVTEGLSLHIEEVIASGYSFSVMPPATYPSFITFHDQSIMDGRKLPWLQMRLPYSENDSLTSEDNFTTAPLHLILAAAKVHLLEPIPIRSRVPNGQQMYNEAMQLLTDESRLRTLDGPAQRAKSFSLAQYRN